MTASVLCIGSALWDVIGHAGSTMAEGDDRPGRISRHPGGVALNIAHALLSANVHPVMLSAIGRDPEGDTLIAQMEADGIECTHITRTSDRTDIYMAIEHEGRLFGAVADCASLERAGSAVFAPLRDGTLTPDPFTGTAIIDGNLPADVLEEVVQSGLLAEADVIFVPASPGKARRLVPVLQAAHATLCVNRFEAEVICAQAFADSTAAATALTALGTAALVTDGARSAALVRDGRASVVTPPAVAVQRVTGAGDAFLAGFVAAQINGADDADCLTNAANMAARHISETR